MEDRFKIFMGAWPLKYTDETICGSGSLYESCKQWVKVLPDIVNEYGIKTINDIGCGDLNWISHVHLDMGIDYLGYDLCVRNTKKSSMYKIHQVPFDIVLMSPRNCELTICKDVICHLSMSNAVKAIQNIRSTCNYLIVTDYPEVTKNVSHPSDGSWNKYNLSISPFNLGKYAIKTFYETHVTGITIPFTLFKFK